MNRSMELLALASLLGSGAIGGIFFAFSSFIMPALAKLTSDQGIAAMQSINVAVIRPSFLGAFLGTAVLSVGMLVLAGRHWGEPGAVFFAAGGALYLFGTFVVTIAGNVPLNDALESVNRLDAAAGEAWVRYVRHWSRWNHVRTLAALLATMSFGVGLAR